MQNEYIFYVFKSEPTVQSRLECVNQKRMGSSVITAQSLTCETWVEPVKKAASFDEFTRSSCQDSHSDRAPQCLGFASGLV